MKNTDNPKHNSKMVRNTKNLISVIFLSLVSILALSTCIGLLLSNAATRRQADASQNELDVLESEGYYTMAQASSLIEKAEANARRQEGDLLRNNFREKLVEGDRIGAIRTLFPDEIVTEYGGQYFFTPIAEDVNKSPVLPDEFTLLSDGKISYNGADESIRVTQGVDISKAQGAVEFDKVKESGVDFVMVKAGARNSSDGNLQEDDNLKSNLRNALKAELEVGVYFYSQAVNEAEAREEAQFVLDSIEGYDITYPIAIDIEQFNTTDVRTSKLSGRIYTEIVRGFCDTIKQAGYRPMILGNIRTFSELVDIHEASQYPIWISYFGYPQYFPYEYYMWQYNKNGDIDGIHGDVNLNICITTK
ncbi:MULTISPECIES: glycoside hydrolase family 25 protein [unclassified Butyrivibrio]|uniref:glycoside hydrolase family 25 protein n=2 Tax=unclassified Butyrivibrio TaxID=2639466 RepID=UPI000417E0F8|nr:MULTISPECIES: glycoside hydrolase family 25 protein [unclassified Butyrivibrio]